jgi:hypothetical protein
LTFGLIRWPPARYSYSRPRRNVSQKIDTPHRPDFEMKDADDIGDVLMGMVDYFAAASFFVAGLVIWRRRAIKGYRISQLWEKNWAGGRALRILLQLHLLATAYSVLLCVGLIASFF